LGSASRLSAFLPPLPMRNLLSQRLYYAFPLFKNKIFLAHSLESQICRIIHFKSSRSRVGMLHYGFRCADKKRVTCSFSVRFDVRM
jgi:hypothetical protein